MAVTARNVLQPKIDFSPLIWASFVLLAINGLAFIVSTAAPHVDQDVWRHLDRIIIPLLEENAPWTILWSNHHPSPLLHLIQIANLKYFGFRLDYHAYLGFSFQLLTTLVILNRVVATTGLEGRKLGLGGALCLLLMLFIALGFNTIFHFRWPLLSTVQYLYFFGIVTYTLTDSCLQRESLYRHLALAGAGLVFLAANADFGTIFLVALAAVLVLSFCFSRKAVYLRTTMTIAAAMIINRLVFMWVLPEGPARPPHDIFATLERLLQSPWQTISQTSAALSRGLLDLASLSEEFPELSGFVVVFAVFIAIVFAATFFLYLQRGLYRLTVTPLALMVVSVLFIGSAFVYRWFLITADLWAVGTPRYVPTFNLAIIGMLWALWLIVKDYTQRREKPIHEALKWAGGLVMVLILAIQGLQIDRGWGEVKRLKHVEINAALAIYLARESLGYSVDLPRPLTVADNRYRKVLSFLERHELNVFSPKYPVSTLLDQHREAREKFDSSDPGMMVSFEDSSLGQLNEESASIAATWQPLEDGFDIRNESGGPLFLRVQVTARPENRGGKHLRVTRGNTLPQKIQMYNGSQQLYFSLEKGDVVRVQIGRSAAIRDFELRE